MTFPLACFAAAPSRLRHALSSVRLLMLLHWKQDAHFAVVVIANSLEGALLRVSRGKLQDISARLLRRGPFSSQTRSLFSAVPEAAALGTGCSLCCGRDRELARRGSAARLAGHV